ncbi:MAG: DUF3995 domain-containing protein [Dehalococcoidia bacterium]|jgi:hypothetical protein|nr:DUF3995 domain-containing protein [Dehalococcoidia bacterium]MDP6226987.1 DUF3995 domain-containing protein [Dehalococcoidia bacterium]MDP7084856.1 DUF3995 domain-containing protein [Dehalococcoidia bacterium]MDP7201780.1 DUF3995 domain-containing protein [Dehalococcoidia bacterium]MDP7509259.1 DUF3995 domain-containing protein [Dehalococcoidia bacterium]|tara:strand:- start:345 stop:770 length:426 start_codon:yes stop_codon:yes gene_type:complete
MSLPSLGAGVVRPASATAASVFTVVAAFQVFWALGGTWGLSAAWGGAHADLSSGLRAASALSAVLLLAGAIVVLGRAGYRVVAVPAGVLRWGTWVIVAILAVSALGNFASSSDWERFLNGPVALLSVLLCIVVARSSMPQR